MVWPRGFKPHGYDLVQQGVCEDHVENVITPLMDLADIRQLVSEDCIHRILLLRRQHSGLALALYSAV
jgi:hypothetical protein